ncbi:accessory gene regulator B family protein [Tissierella sp.]|uniref:accessory gene regulator ArgB-like protein n=1 Tax=Tissierella sp. TaxID=41274 RepID=UPI002857427B|nr:accessory gene regulator B family protein [Tissierella sp.]MDR7856823.1 accessory gene regulator B family protein [Tissierella sp.]
MTEFICKVTLKKLCDKNIIGEEDIDVYHYGLELLLATLFKAMGLMAIAAITGLVKEAIIFTMFFSSLRVQAGGYHAKTIIGCFIGMVVFTFTSITLVRMIPLDYQQQYILVAVVSSIALVFVYAPMESENKPLTEEEEILYRRRSLGTVIAGSIIIFHLVYLNSKLNYLGTIASTGFLLESLTLIHFSKNRNKV